jgi:hypothetical protein
VSREDALVKYGLLNLVPQTFFLGGGGAVLGF